MGGLIVCAPSQVPLIKLPSRSVSWYPRGGVTASRLSTHSRTSLRPCSVADGDRSSGLSSVRTHSV